MKVQIDIEEFDNGITLKWHGHDLNGEQDNERLVALDREKESVIGKTIWDDIRCVIDKELVSKVRMTIEYEPIKGQSDE